MEWAAIIAMLLEQFGPILQKWLEECLDPETEAGVKRIREFGPAVQAVVMAAAKKHARKELGMTGRDKRKERKEYAEGVVAELKAKTEVMSDDEIRTELQLAKVCCGLDQEDE